MAVRVPPRPGGPSPLESGAGAPLSSLERALLQSGLAKTPEEARALAAKLVAALQRAGLPIPTKLDAATLARLKESGVLAEAGVVEGGASRTKPGRGAVLGDALGDVLGRARVSERPRAKEWRDFSLQARETIASGSGAEAPAGTRTHEVAHAQTRARAELSRDDAPRSLQDLLTRLSTLGFPGAGKGQRRLASALTQLQASAGLPLTGRFDERTVQELVRRGVLPEGSELAARLPSSSSSSSSKESTPVATPGRPESERGRAMTETQGSAPVSGQGGAGAGEGLSDGAYAVLGHTDPRGEVEDDANAPAGDEDREDHRRGHASLDDESESEEGYWEVPSLADQIRAALEHIERNDDEKGAATYSWDVTFFRPGVYGRRQPAEPLWHVVVDRASPFDLVWREAKEKLALRLAELEPDAVAPRGEDFQAALRRARVRTR